MLGAYGSDEPGYYECHACKAHTRNVAAQLHGVRAGERLRPAVSGKPSFTISVALQRAQPLKVGLAPRSYDGRAARTRPVQG